MSDSKDNKTGQTWDADIDQKRQEANREILALIAAEVEASPGLRFSQILRNLGVIEEVNNPNFSWDLGRGVTPYIWINEFNTEPWAILDRMKKIKKARVPIK